MQQIGVLVASRELLNALQVCQTLFDPMNKIESSPGSTSMWRISEACQIVHETKPAASQDHQKGRPDFDFSTTARSKNG